MKPYDNGPSPTDLLIIPWVMPFCASAPGAARGKQQRGGASSPLPPGDPEIPVGFQTLHLLSYMPFLGKITSPSQDVALALSLGGVGGAQEPSI